MQAAGQVRCGKLHGAVRCMPKTLTPLQQAAPSCGCASQRLAPWNKPNCQLASPLNQVKICSDAWQTYQAQRNQVVRLSACRADLQHGAASWTCDCDTQSNGLMGPLARGQVAAASSAGTASRVLSLAERGLHCSQHAGCSTEHAGVGLSVQGLQEALQGVHATKAYACPREVAAVNVTSLF